MYSFACGAVYHVLRRLERSDVLSRCHIPLKVTHTHVRIRYRIFLNSAAGLLGWRAVNDTLVVHFRVWRLLSSLVLPLHLLAFVSKLILFILFGGWFFFYIYWSLNRRCREPILSQADVVLLSTELFLGIGAPL